MNLYLIGIDYKRTPLDIRSLAFKNRRKIEAFCSDTLRGRASVLFTCNRVEIYGIAENELESLAVFNKVKCSWGSVFQNAYFKKNTHETIRHVFRLACGLESQIAFESQIIEQLNSWIKRSMTPQEIKRDIYPVLSFVQDIRSVTGINTLKKDIIDFVLEDIKKRISGLGTSKLLVIGTGKLAELIAKKSLNYVSLFFAARKRHDRALNLAEISSGRLISFEDLPDMIYEVDAVISATSSSHYVLKPGALFEKVNKRKHPLYIYDLAAPKDCHPDMSLLDNVKVMDIYDMSLSLEQYRNSLKPHIAEVESLIEQIMQEVDGAKNQNWNKTEFACV